MSEMTMLSFLIISLFVFGVAGFTQQECVDVNQVEACYSTFTKAVLTAAHDFVQACTSSKVYMECVEHAACQCNLTTDAAVASALTYIHGLYTSKGCQSVAGPLVEKQGVECYNNITNTTTKGEIVALAVADSALVVELERVCTGYRDCYVTYDATAAIALHHRNLTGLCSILKQTLQCFQSTACACGQLKHAEITADIVYNRNVYMSTCEIIKKVDDIHITCDNNETEAWINPSSCLDSNPLYGCFFKFKSDLTAAASQVDLRCNAYKLYMECVERMACQCGLVRDATVYRSLATFASRYNKEQCHTLSERLQITAGMHCPHGGGTTNEEDRIVLALAETPAVVSEDKSCPGLYDCYSALDEQLGKALFIKDLQNMCVAQKTYVECLERVFCNCGTFNFLNVTEFLHFQRQTHQSTCSDDAPILTTYLCTIASSSSRFLGLQTTAIVSVIVWMLSCVDRI